MQKYKWTIAFNFLAYSQSENKKEKKIDQCKQESQKENLTENTPLPTRSEKQKDKKRENKKDLDES